MNKSKIISIVLALVVVLGAGGVAAYALLFRNALEKEAGKAQEEIVVDAPEGRMTGNYDVVFEYADSTVRFSGNIKEGVTSDFVLTIMSEYAPRVVMLNVEDGGAIASEELGKGKMYYKESIDKTTIRFEKEDYTCVLTK